MKVSVILLSAVAIGLYAFGAVSYMRLYNKYVTQAGMMEEYAEIHWLLGDVSQTILSGSNIPMDKVAYEWAVTFPLLSTMAFNYMNGGNQFQNLGIVATIFAERKLHCQTDINGWLLALIYYTLAHYCFANGQRFKPLGWVDLITFPLSFGLAGLLFFCMTQGFPPVIYESLAMENFKLVTEQREQVALGLYLSSLAALGWRSLARCYNEFQPEAYLYWFGTGFLNLSSFVLIMNHYGLSVIEPLTFHMVCLYFAHFVMAMCSVPRAPVAEEGEEEKKEETKAVTAPKSGSKSRSSAGEKKNK